MTKERLAELDAMLADPSASFGDVAILAAQVSATLKAAWVDREWQPISTAPTKDRIRIIGGIGGLAGFVVGDIFFGPASMLLCRLHDAKYVAERSESTWRYTQGEDRLEEHMRPTHWMPLPLPPATSNGVTTS